MPRKWRMDDDEDRLPEGFRRIGYDAELSLHYFEDAEGKYWQSKYEYGVMVPSDGPSWRHSTYNPQPTFKPSDPASIYEAREFKPSEPASMHEGREMRGFAAFLVLCLTFMFVLIWFVTARGGSETSPIGRPDAGKMPAPPADCPQYAKLYTVADGDTCYEIANGDTAEVGEIIRLNPQADCDALKVGQVLCVPTAMLE